MNAEAAWPDARQISRPNRVQWHLFAIILKRQDELMPIIGLERYSCEPQGSWCVRIGVPNDVGSGLIDREANTVGMGGFNALKAAPRAHAVTNDV